MEIYGIDNPQLITVAVDPDSKAVLDTFDK